MIPVRIGLQQRVLPIYRQPFFQALAAACPPNGLGIFAGEPRPNEMVENCLTVPGAQVTPAHNRHLFQGRWYLCWQSGLLHWLKTWQPEILILEANPRYLLSPLAVRWMHRHRRKVIGWGLGAPPTTTLRSIWRSLFLSQFDAMITYSQQGAQQYQAAGLSSRRIFIARNAIAPRPSNPPPERPAVSATAPILIYVGRLQPRKRVDLLIRACAEQPTPPQLWIVGDGPERPRLEALATDIFPQTVFWGTKHGNDLTHLLDQADLFVLPGTGGLAVQQAMSRSLPVIVAAGDGTQSDLVRPENGWNIPANDLPALSTTLRAALADGSRLRQMGLASYHIVSNEVHLEAMVAAFESAIQATL